MENNVDEFKYLHIKKRIEEIDQMVRENYNTDIVRQQFEGFCKLLNCNEFNEVCEKHKNLEILPNVTLEELIKQPNWVEILFKRTMIFYFYEALQNDDPEVFNYIIEEINHKIELIDSNDLMNIDFLSFKSLKENPILKSTRPKKAVINNSKLANEITKDFIGTGQIELEVGGTKKHPISVFAALDYDNEDLTITGRQPFTAYDRTVHNAVCTLYEAGNVAFTPEMVYRAMNGLNDTEWVSPQAIGAATKSIEKSRYTKLTIDFTQQALAKNLKVTKTTIDDMLLSAQKITVNIPGSKEPKEAYQFNTKPILYKYSQEIKQVITIPIKLLRTKEKLNTTDEITVLREYLLKRIEGMKGRNRLNSNKIVYETIYKELELNEPTKQKAAKIRGHAKDLLRYWKQESHIKDFEEYKEDGRTIKGIEIEL